MHRTYTLVTIHEAETNEQAARFVSNVTDGESLVARLRIWLARTNGVDHGLGYDTRENDEGHLVITFNGSRDNVLYIAVCEPVEVL